MNNCPPNCMNCLADRIMLDAVEKDNPKDNEGEEVHEPWTDRPEYGEDGLPSE